MSRDAAAYNAAITAAGAGRKRLGGTGLSDAQSVT